MKNFNFLIIFLAFSFTSLNGQSLDIISSDFEDQSYAITFLDKAFVVQQNSNHISSYDGRIFSRFNFPSREGTMLRYHSYNNEMVVHNYALYMVLHDVENYDSLVHSTTRYFYRFNGSTFTAISLPGKPVSSPVVYQDNVYIMVDIEGEVKLFLHNGSSLHEVASSGIPLFSLYKLIVAGQYLYINGYGRSHLSSMKRYDGMNIITVPNNYGITDISIRASAGNEEIFIFNQIDGIYYHLTYFNGSAIYTWYDGYRYDIQGLGNIFYFFPPGNSITRVENGYDFTSIPLPESAIIPGRVSERINPIVFQDKIFFLAELPDRSRVIYQFDGVTFTRVNILPNTLISVDFYGRGNELIIQENYSHAIKFSKFDGSVYSEIIPPRGRNIEKYLTSTSCFHLWEICDSRGAFQFAKEERPCSSPVSIIPELVRKFEKAEFSMFGKYRGWCWSELLWDWEINPECPFCPEPRFGASMADSKGNLAWEETFKEPFNIKIPLEDIQSYTLTLSSIVEKSTKNFFIIGDDLVSKGFSSLEMSMIPAKEFFYIKAETKDKKNVPFTMRLLNDKGETLWKEDFIAPINKEITAKVDKPGTILMITSSEGNKKQENFNIKMNATPNPFHDKLEVGIQSFDNKEIPIALSIINLNGQVIYEKSILTPAMESINLFHQKSGIYILRMVSGNEVRTQLIKLER